MYFTRVPGAIVVDVPAKVCRAVSYVPVTNVHVHRKKRQKTSYQLYVCAVVLSKVR